MSSAIDDHVRRQFVDAAGYLDTASLGLPPTATAAALHAAVDAWRRGAARAPDYDVALNASRWLFAGVMGVPAEWIAVGSQVSPFAGLLAQSLPERATVLCPEGEFTSVLFPFLVAQRRGLTVRTVPLERLAEAIEPDVDVVAFSAVQSSDGRVAELDAIGEAAASCGALTFVDATQAAGWLPLDAMRFDLVAAGAYKWLLSARGTSFCSVRPERLAQLTPINAGWYAGEDPWQSIYGAPLRLAESARRLDVSPAWLSWVGTRPSLELIANIGVPAIHAHNVELANALRERLGMEPSDSAIVSAPFSGDPSDLAEKGVRASVRAGRLRVCFHLYNTLEDVERVAGALAGAAPARF